MTRPGGSKRIWSLHTAEVNGTVLRVTHLEDKMTEGDPATSSLPFIHRELGICKGPQKPSTNVFHVKVSSSARGHPQKSQNHQLGAKYEQKASHDTHH